MRSVERIGEEAVQAKEAEKAGKQAKKAEAKAKKEEEKAKKAAERVKKQQEKCGAVKRKRHVSTSSSSSDDSNDVDAVNSSGTSDPETFSDFETLSSNENEESDSSENEAEIVDQAAVDTAFPVTGINVGDFVVVEYEGHDYPGKVTRICGSKYTVSCLHRMGNKAQWTWPTPVDEFKYKRAAVKMRIAAPKQLGRRSIYVIPELN